MFGRVWDEFIQVLDCAHIAVILLAIPAQFVQLFLASTLRKVMHNDNCRALAELSEEIASFVRPGHRRSLSMARPSRNMRHVTRLLVKLTPIVVGCDASSALTGVNMARGVGEWVGRGGDDSTSAPMLHPTCIVMVWSSNSYS